MDEPRYSQDEALSLVEDYAEKTFKQLSISDLVSFLKQIKIPPEFCEKFRGQSCQLSVIIVIYNYIYNYL